MIYAYRLIALRDGSCLIRRDVARHVVPQHCVTITGGTLYVGNAVENTQTG